MQERNEIVRKMIEDGKSYAEIARLFGVSGERISQIDRCDNKQVVGRRGTKLSPREDEVILLIANGFSDQAIADKLILSARTVQTHAERIRVKLDAVNRANAVYLRFGGAREAICE